MILNLKNDDRQVQDSIYEWNNVIRLSIVLEEFFDKNFDFKS